MARGMPAHGQELELPICGKRTLGHLGRTQTTLTGGQRSPAEHCTSMHPFHTAAQHPITDRHTQDRESHNGSNGNEPIWWDQHLLLIPGLLCLRSTPRSQSFPGTFSVVRLSSFQTPTCKLRKSNVSYVFWSFLNP